MEYTIYDLMRGLQDGSVALPEDEAADLRPSGNEWMAAHPCDVGA